MDELRARRLAVRQRKATEEIAETLWTYYQAAVDGEAEWVGGPPKAVLIIPIFEDGPSVDWAGTVTNQDFRDVRLSIDDVLHPGTLERCRQAEEAERLRVREYELSHPWMCGHPHCGQRFKTEGARKRHERHYCYFRPTTETP